MLLWVFGFLFPMKLGLSIAASALSVLPVPRAGREHDPPVLAAHHPPLVLTEENIGESPEECGSNKLQHLYVCLTFNVYKFGWQSHERGFDQIICQLDLNALLVSGQSGNTLRTACSKQAPK